MAKQRVTEDFVRHYELLRDRAGNTPFGVQRALDRDPQLAVSIRELDRIWRLIQEHRRKSKRRVIVQTHPKFPAAAADYLKRWQNTWGELLDWEDRREGREPLGDWLVRVLAETPEAPGPPEAPPLIDEDWDFDPDEHRAAPLIEGMADYVKASAEHEPFCSRATQAYEWMTNTVGLDLRSIEQRWREFPVIHVPEGISNAHGINDPYSLFGYLDNVRLAYEIGADLAAIAMCRAGTEILIRIHYTKDAKTDLIPLIKQIQRRREFSFLRHYNLVAKVDEANRILHFDRDDIKNADRSRALIREWVAALQEMITSAPSTP
jgi:hypothetical protein